MVLYNVGKKQESNSSLFFNKLFLLI